MLAGSHSELFTGISIVHPAMLDVKDVDALAVPLALYPSKVGFLHPLTTAPLLTGSCAG